MASGNNAMVLEQGSGWARGLRNMLRGELGSWFGTRRWWVRTLIWAALVNFIYLTSTFAAKGQGLDGIMIFNVFMGLAIPIGVTITMQHAVIGEKRDGTAAWILSKPVSRQAFLGSKLIANGIGIGVTMVLVQGVIAYVITGLVLGVWLSPLGFLAGLGAHLANMLFYLTLTLMLGVLVERPAPVIGIPLVLLFAQNMLGPKLAELSPALANALPWTLAVPFGGASGANGVATALMTGQPTPLTAVYTAVAASVIFVSVAIIVFGRQDF